MGPNSLATFKVLTPLEKRLWSDSRHVFFDIETGESIIDIYYDVMDDFHLYIKSRQGFDMPGDSVIVEKEGSSAFLIFCRKKYLVDSVEDFSHVHYLETISDEDIVFGTVGQNKGIAFAGFLSNSDMQLDLNFSDEERKKLEFLASFMLFSFHLMAMPRTLRSENMSRIKRQRAKKKMGRYYPLSWSKVSWEIGGFTKAKELTREASQRMPKHEVKEHWRFVGRKTEKSELKYFDSHGYGYYTKIPAHTRGDESYGVKMGKLSPTIRADFNPAQSVKINALLAATEAMQDKP